MSSPRYPASYFTRILLTANFYPDNKLGMQRRYIAFEGSRRIAEGSLVEVVTAARPAVARRRATTLIFDAETAEQVEIDFRGSLDAVLARLATAVAPGDHDGAPAPEVAQAEGEAVRGRGRPRLGVVAREVTLLPRHWEWLHRQPGGASAALRRLVDAARKAHDGQDRVRRHREAVYRFTQAMAGDAPGFEEATRALFAGDRARFEQHTAAWPPDVRSHALAMATRAFEAP